MRPSAWSAASELCSLLTSPQVVWVGGTPSELEGGDALLPNRQLLLTPATLLLRLLRHCLLTAGNSPLYKVTSV